MPSPTAAITASHLTKSYGSGDNLVVALSDVSFSVGQGESVAIVGKSGSGKSTLMHLLALMDLPSSGEIMIGGENAGQLTGRKLNRLRNRSFGFVFQQFFLDGNSSVLDNVILPLKIAGVGRAERDQRGREVLNAVELNDKVFSLASDLSGGQKQRAVIARALINRPHIIFADEPTGNLDSATGRKIEDMLFELNRQESITLFIVTHDLDLAARCDRQIQIKDGRLVDSPERAAR